MSHLPQPFKVETLPATALNPAKLAIARNLSQDMAVVQANELLAQDILNKVASGYFENFWLAKRQRKLPTDFEMIRFSPQFITRENLG